MKLDIQSWIRIARRLGKHILEPSDIDTDSEIKIWRETYKSSEKVMKDLNDPHFFAQKAVLKEEINKRHTWEDFIVWRRQRDRNRRLQLLRYAAVVLIVMASVPVIWFLVDKPVEFPVVVQSGIEAGGKKAFLKLDNGNEIFLDKQLLLKEEDGIVIRNTQIGEVSYQDEGSIPLDSVIRYNTLFIPRGGEYQITLADGTKVWMNSDSKLIFPVRFPGNKREVILEGEAYFEVAHDTTRPFYVKACGIDIRATGTAFNVMAYGNEPECKVTLVEGGVNIEKNEFLISQLTPRIQFCIDLKTQEYKTCEVDLRVSIAWKDRIFFFEQESFRSIIAKLSRWYDITIVCNTPDLYDYRFSGEIRKYENVLKVLDMLKLTNEITYSLQADRSIMIYKVND